jgi:hypothetical protein
MAPSPEMFETLFNISIGDSLALRELKHGDDVTTATSIEKMVFRVLRAEQRTSPRRDHAQKVNCEVSKWIKRGLDQTPSAESFEKVDLVLQKLFSCLVLPIPPSSIEIEPFYRISRVLVFRRLKRLYWFSSGE